MPIDRMSTTIDDIVALERNRLIAAADNGADDDVPPEDRPNRRDGNGNLYVVAGSNVKFNDDLKFNDDAVCRVLCGARGRDYIATWRLAIDGVELGTRYVGDIVDRAPADPLETPMPIFPEPEPPPEE